MTRIAHLIPSGLAGGAESTLLKVIAGTQSTEIQHEVYTLLEAAGPVADAMRALGIEVRSLGMRRGRASLLGVIRFVRVLRRRRPDILHTWMYHSDLIGGLAAATCGVRPATIWSLRRTLDPEHTSARTVRVARACGYLSSRIPSRIVSCGEAISASHIAAGYDESKIRVIPNGFDLGVFRPSAARRAQSRDAMGIEPDAAVIGLVARYEPVKDHKTFIAAARVFAESVPDAVFVLCGRDADWDNADLGRLVEATGVADRFRLLGERRDVYNVYPALDVATLCSRTEGFPNVVGEAMACGVPCVVTDVGDAAAIVGDTGHVVEPGDVRGIAGAWSNLLREPDSERARRAARARDRVAQHYSLEAVVRLYCELYEGVMVNGARDDG